MKTGLRWKTSFNQTTNLRERDRKRKLGMGYASSAQVYVSRGGCRMTYSLILPYFLESGSLTDRSIVSEQIFKQSVPLL